MARRCSTTEPLPPGIELAEDLNANWQPRVIDSRVSAQQCCSVSAAGPMSIPQEPVFLPVIPLVSQVIAPQIGVLSLRPKPQICVVFMLPKLAVVRLYIIFTVVLIEFLGGHDFWQPSASSPTSWTITLRLLATNLPLTPIMPTCPSVGLLDSAAPHVSPARLQQLEGQPA